MALGPVLVFLLQLGEGRLRPGAPTLTVVVLYSLLAVQAARLRMGGR